MDVATEKEQKDGRKPRAYISELGERQGALIKKNLDGYISDTVLKQQLDLIEKELTDAQINLASIQEQELNFDELLDHAEKYLENPSAIWKKAKLEKRLKLQWFQFPQGITFENNNCETANLAFVFKTKDAFLRPLSSIVDPNGFEPLTSSVQMRRSTN